MCGEGTWKECKVVAFNIVKQILAKKSRKPGKCKDKDCPPKAAERHIRNFSPWFQSTEICVELQL